MKPISEITKAIPKKSETNSKKSQSETLKQTDSSNLSDLPKHWVSALFTKLQARYLHKWTSAISGIEESAIAEWSHELAGLSGEAIRAGLDALNSDWPPSAPEFAKLCREADGRIPSLAEAWHIACNARGKPGSLQERYKHPVVLAAISHKDCDIFCWSQLPEAKGLLMFSRIYDKILNRHAAGEIFDWPLQRNALDDRSRIAVTPLEKSRLKYRTRCAIRSMRWKISGTSPATAWQNVHGMRALV